MINNEDQTQNEKRHPISFEPITFFDEKEPVDPITIIGDKVSDATEAAIKKAEPVFHVTFCKEEPVADSLTTINKEKTPLSAGPTVSEKQNRTIDIRETSVSMMPGISEQSSEAACKTSSQPCGLALASTNRENRKGQGYFPYYGSAQQQLEKVSDVLGMPALGPRKRNITPMVLAEKVKHWMTLCVKDSKLYMYNGSCYRCMEQSDMETIIWGVCGEEMQRVGNRTILSGAYNLLLVDPSLKAEHLQEAWNMVPFSNGLLNLDNGMLIPSSADYFATYILNCAYPLKPEECPAFDSFLQDISCGDPLLIARIWEVIGLCLTQDVSAKAIFVFQGIPNSGKSVLANILKCFFPKELQTALDAHDMGERFAIGECEGKLLCVSSDMPAEALGGKAVSNLKKLSGRDTVSSAVKHDQKRKEFLFTGKIIMVTNNPLLLKQEDAAFRERIVTIPFKHEIPREKRIDGLESRLISEMPAIAAKALNAYFRLRSNCYRFSGDFCINSQELYPQEGIGADPMTAIYLYLMKYYTVCQGSTVIVEEARSDFNRIYGLSMTTQVFSAMFCKQAEKMFGAVKVRTRDGGFENARSAVSGIKRRLV